MVIFEMQYLLKSDLKVGWIRSTQHLKALDPNFSNFQKNCNLWKFVEKLSLQMANISTH